MRYSAEVRPHQLLPSVLTLFLLAACDAQTDQPTLPRNTQIIDRSVDGAATNGFRAHVALHWNHGFESLPQGAVSISITTNTVTIDPKPPHNWCDPKFKYFTAVNVGAGPLWIAGPMELRDISGQTMPTLRPELVSAAAYPPNLRFSAIHNNQRKGEGFSHLRMPMAFWRESFQFGSFNLGEYFKVTKPGEYRLKVWPKIYEKSKRDGDLLERIDLPPVSVSFTYQPSP